MIISNMDTPMPDLVYIIGTVTDYYLSVNKGDNVFETKYIYEDSSKNLYEPNLIKLEHSLSFKPSEIYKKSRDHRSLTLKSNEISVRD